MAARMSDVPAWIQNLVVCMATVTFQRSNLCHFKTAIASDKNDVKYSVATNKGTANGVAPSVKTDNIEKETNKNDVDFGKEPISVMVAILDEMKKHGTETVILTAKYAAGDENRERMKKLVLPGQPRPLFLTDFVP